MTAIYLKELKGYFHSMMGYVYLAFFTIAIAIYYVYYCVLNAMTNFASYVLGNVTVIFLIAIPMLSMRLIAEEKKQKTDQLLFTAPIRTWEIVVGKYLAALTVFTISLLIIALFPIITSIFGPVNWAMTLTGFLGTFLLGASLIAIGLLISCTTEHQMIVAVLSFAVFLMMFMLEFIAEAFHNIIANVISWFSMMDRFNNFISGILNVSSIIYYCSFIAVSLFIGTQILERRRWK